MSATQTQCARLLAELREGPRSAAELYRLGCIVHSRVADLRRRGHIITCERLPGASGPQAYLYRLERDGVGV